MIPWWTLCSPQQLQKLQVRFSLSKNIRGSVQQRLTRCRKGELLPEAGRPEDDMVQGGQSAGSGESLQADTLGVASEPSRKRAMAEHGKFESAQDAGGGRVVDVTPLSELGQAVKAPPVEPAHATTAERTDAATASTNTAVAGPQPKTSAAGIPPGGPAGVDEDEYTSESTEEVPALRGEPLTKGVRMWTPSQFPLVMTLCKDLKSGEFLPEEVQVERLGYGRTRAVYSLPSIGPYSHYGDCVLKLCMVRQHHGKEAEWGSHCNLVATTIVKGQVSLDFGQEAKFVHFSIQKRAVMVQDWLAQWGNNPSLVRDMAHYLLVTLFSLELRGAILCDTGPTNAMVRTKDPYARAVFGDAAGWSLRRKLRHRGVGGFLNIFQAYPAVQAELERILAVAKQTGLQPAFKLAANNCGRFGVFLVDEGLAVLETNTQNLAPANLPLFPQNLTWAELPE